MMIPRKSFDPEIFAEAWELSGLYVRREYQRRGLAKIMLKWGLDQAAAEMVPVVVKSSPAGIKTYEQAGFRVFEKLELGFNPGGRGINKWVWEPPGMELQWHDRARGKVEAEKKKAVEGAPRAVIA
jgi:GNAT superfamily N-acetyltransferase